MGDREAVIKRRVGVLKKEDGLLFHYYLFIAIDFMLKIAPCVKT